MRLRGMRRRWRRTTMDGIPVRLSVNTGPAVVGVWRPEVLVPEWVRVAVVSTLGSARFTPALRKGQRVRQLVQQPFKFAPNAQVQPQAR